MGLEYTRRGIGQQGGLTLPSESITLAAAAQTLKNEGVSVLTYASSGGARDALLPNPDFAGQVKVVVLNNQTTSLEAKIHTISTARVFFGTTFNTITAGSTDSQPKFLQFVGVSNTQWAITALSNSTLSTAAVADHWVLSASTGSTATA